MRFLYLLDSGHGGYCCGKYLVRGKNGHLTENSKKSPWKRKWKDPGIWEGKFNREIAELICDMTSCSRHLNPGPIDIRLKDRVQYINAIAKDRKVCLISIHANAARGGDWSDARGFAVFHSHNASVLSERLADAIRRKWIAHVPEIPNRGIKVANHVITTKTKCPAVLIESGFMTNYKEAELLSIGFIKQKIADAISRAIISFDNSLSE